MWSLEEKANCKKVAVVSATLEIQKVNAFRITEKKHFLKKMTNDFVNS